MICGLFSSFDPMVLLSSNYIELKWFMILFSLFFISWQLFVLPVGFNMLKKLLVEFLFNSVGRVFSNPMQSFQLLFVLFYIILIMNFSGLIPFMFSPSSHLVVNMSFSLPLWMAGVIYGLVSSYRSVLAHLVPTGSPNSLWMFLVIVESISLIIRPITLSVRLMANVMAGHLIMSLIGEGGVVSFMSVFPSSVIEMLILGFELCVSLVQSYVFVNLLSLYWLDNEH